MHLTPNKQLLQHYFPDCILIQQKISHFKAKWDIHPLTARPIKTELAVNREAHLQGWNHLTMLYFNLQRQK